MHYKNFGTWNYQGAVVLRGLWEIQYALSEDSDFSIEPFLNDQLNFYQVNNHTQCGNTKNLLSLKKSFVKTTYSVILC